MWTRGDLEYAPRRIAPWYPPMEGYPGYWGQRTGHGHTALKLERGPAGEVAPGFGYAKDPSDPMTWRDQPTIFT
jgi:hypothetical protein